MPLRPPIRPDPAPAVTEARATRPALERHGPIRQPIAPPAVPPTSPSDPALDAAYRVVQAYLDEGRRYTEANGAWATPLPRAGFAIPEVVRQLLPPDSDWVRVATWLLNELVRAVPQTSSPVAVPPVMSAPPTAPVSQNFLGQVPLTTSVEAPVAPWIPPVDPPTSPADAPTSPPNETPVGPGPTIVSGLVVPTQWVVDFPKTGDPQPTGKPFPPLIAGFRGVPMPNQPFERRSVDTARLSASAPASSQVPSVLKSGLARVLASSKLGF
jgi:hypothetical protein